MFMQTLTVFLTVSRDESLFSGMEEFDNNALLPTTFSTTGAPFWSTSFFVNMLIFGKVYKYTV